MRPTSRDWDGRGGFLPPETGLSGRSRPGRVQSRLPGPHGAGRRQERKNGMHRGRRNSAVVGLLIGVVFASPALAVPVADGLIDPNEGYTSVIPLTFMLDQGQKIV